jgi:hypothetical protein
LNGCPFGFSAAYTIVPEVKVPATKATIIAKISIDFVIKNNFMFRI